MRLIMWNLMTLDGLFEGPRPWALEWHEDVWGEELERFSLEQARTAECLLFGRVTYEGMAAYWSTATGAIADFMNHVPKIVFSRTLAAADWHNTRLVRTDAAAEVLRLKERPGKDMYLFGSAKLCETLMQANLIDEYRLGLAPVVLGRGTPLFKAGTGRRSMTLLEARPLRSGCVILRYAPVATPQ